MAVAPRIGTAAKRTGGSPGVAQPDALVLPRSRTERKLARPQLYRVLLHNDDYTTMEFVVAILQGIFHRSEAEATQVMLHVHRNGVGVAGVYTKEVAESKVAEVTRAAEEAQFPLLCTMEPDQASEDNGS
jgi:ATP-dependent Clp protease adaptor protein ClpS